MINPRLVKQCISKFVNTVADYIIFREGYWRCNEYEAWLTQFSNLTEDQQMTFIKTFERYQTTSIIHGIERKDSKIFLAGLGVFYIKPTTIAYYNKLKELLDGEEPTKENVEKYCKEAMQSAYDKRIQLDNFKDIVRNGK